MKARLRRGVALFMTVLMIGTLLPDNLVFASVVQNDLHTQTEEIQTNEIQANEIQTEVKSTEKPETDTENTRTALKQTTVEVQQASQSDNTQPSKNFLNYVAVDSPYVTTPGTQNIVASIGGNDLNIERAVLTYRNTKSGEELKVQASEIAGNALRFTIGYTDVEQSGTYELVSISYTVAEVEQTITMQEAGVDAKYGVNQTVTTDPDAVTTNGQSTDSDLDLSANVVTLDENGKAVSKQNVKGAIDNAKKELGTAVQNGVARTGLGAQVVVLDPGHGGTDPGTAHNGLAEKDLNLKIALYAKAELEQYGNVKVYLTRSTDTYVGLEDRVSYAQSVGAKVFVSIHVNYDADSSVEGAEIYYPNTNYNATVSVQGADLATKVLNNLKTLGLQARGIKTRDCMDHSAQYQYADGSQADYYSVIRNCKKAGIPGIITEHAFISNIEDVTKHLSSNEQLQQLGIADATGIAQSLGLYKEVEYAYGSAKVTSTQNSMGDAYTVSAANISQAHAVWYAVWSDAGGQDDLKWYVASKDASGNWIATIPPANHNSVGMYHVLTYINRANGTSYNVSMDSLVVKDEASATVQITNQNNVSGTFDVVVSNLKSTFGVKTIEVPVWSTPNQSDIGWYTASLQSDGTYRAHIDITNHNCNYGRYQVHVYLTNNAAGKKFATSTTVVLDKPTATISSALDSTGDTATLTAWHVPGTFGSSLKNVQFAVWSDKNGQDDLHFYNGILSADKYVVSIPLSNHNSTGLFYVHCYATNSTGNRTLVGTSSFEVAKATVAGVQITNKNTVSGNFDVVITGVSAYGGVEQVKVPVWSQSNQSDIQWYTATKRNDGTYAVHVDVANHNCNYGTYQVHTYVVNGFKEQERTNAVAVDIKRPDTTVVTKKDASQTTYTATAWHVPGTFGASLKGVQFAVWSIENGQDDLRWYNASTSADKFVASIPLSNHRTGGTYCIHTYATYSNGGKSLVNTSTFNVEKASVESVKIANLNNVSGNFDVVVTGAQATGGVTQIQIPVWSSANQSDLQWYTATMQSDGTYRAHVDIINHNCSYGTYQVHTYLRDGIGGFQKVSAISVNVAKPSTKVSSKASDDGASFNATAWHVPGTFGASLKGVQYAVWSAANGQDDLKWYNASASADKFVANIPIANHKTTGVYYVHTYATYANGTKEFVGSTSFLVTGPSATSVEIKNRNETAGTFEVHVTGVTSGALVYGVAIPVWSQANQSDLVWYNATKVSANEYVAYIDIKNHGNNLGNYYAHAYVNDLAGFSQKVGSTSAQMMNVNNTYYNIVGSTAVDVSQLVSYYNKHATYPYFYSGTDAPSIQAFCQIYIEESNAEGIKAEVAFCQAMKETGFLRYDGDVAITQFNFAGLGATGNGNPGNSFSTVREGVRAQIQHLKAYASTAPLNNPCVDSRFSYVTRGYAPYVEWLGINENPYGKGWATAKNYGYSLKNDYIAKLL